MAKHGGHVWTRLHGCSIAMDSMLVSQLWAVAIQSTLCYCFRKCICSFSQIMLVSMATFYNFCVLSMPLHCIGVPLTIAIWHWPVAPFFHHTVWVPASTGPWVNQSPPSSNAQLEYTMSAELWVKTCRLPLQHSSIACCLKYLFPMQPYSLI